MRLTQNNTAWMAALTKERKLEETAEVQAYLQARRETEEMYLAETKNLAVELGIDVEVAVAQQLTLTAICNYWSLFKTGEMEETMEQLYESMNEADLFTYAKMVNMLIHEEKAYREIVKYSKAEYEKLTEMETEELFCKDVKNVYVGEGDPEMSAIAGVELENGKLFVYGARQDREVSSLQEMEEIINTGY